MFSLANTYVNINFFKNFIEKIWKCQFKVVYLYKIIIMITEEENIWLNYVVSICYLNAILHVTNNPYPKHKIRSFDNFINEEDDRKSEGIKGWKYRMNTN